MDHLLSTVNYQEHKRLICRDLKVFGFVLGFQGEYTKYPCLLCLRERRTDDQHYVRQEQPLRQGLKPGSHNVQSHSLVKLNKILLPPLHITLGVMNFVKAMDWDGSGFAFPQKFPQITKEKPKADIFDGSQIRELIKYPIFDEALSEEDLSALQSLKSVFTNILGNPPESGIQ